MVRAREREDDEK